MIRIKSYIINAVQQNLYLEQEAGGPAVYPEDELLFPEQIERRLEFHKEKAQLVEDFEGFMALLDAVLDEEKLEPVDRSKLAALFNKYRLEIEKEPL